MKKEKWGTIPISEKYEISTEGKVRNKKSGILLTPRVRKGYLRINLMDDKRKGKQKTFFVHRLLGLTFIPNPHNLPIIDHINGVKQDNSLENLRWVGHGQNLLNQHPITKTMVEQILTLDKKGLSVYEIVEKCRVFYNTSNFI